MTDKPSFPNAESRKLCWAARDDYFKCLNNNSGDETKCAQKRQGFDEHCSKTWVKYFIRRRDFLKYKDEVQEKGFIPTEDEEKT
ncbi:cytochrome c oxidase assembly factor 6 homolog [Patiria miniata]|uniref:Cytochrome c oxidase assembly factor 6 n=1 Tax=Patiria miniata TaxID=46514 RepID=A0A913ZY26_PATMI|nr:cytochrome c oxidase assembly factor 6 homolog [Patiria miniata]XP_038075630.1 cytochrome c oxidase assembly factor 6 homolog [Patiria miniata]